MINKYLLLIFSGVVLFLVIIGVLLYLAFGKSVKQQLAGNQVIATSPTNGAAGVDVSNPLTITFERPIAGTTQLGFVFAPPLPNQDYAITTKIPSTVVVKPRGLMAPNTTYVVKVNLNQAAIYQFSFTTANSTIQTDAESVKKAQEDLFKDHPLLPYMPYETSDAIVYYTGPFALRVIMKQGVQANVQKEVEGWIRSHGIDPSTHTITYTQQ